MTKLNSTRRISAIGFAGWLFADVLIVLFVVFMGSEVRHSRVEAATPSPSASSEINKVGVLEPDPKEILIDGVDQRGLRSGKQQSVDGLTRLISENSKVQELSDPESRRYSPITLVFSHYKRPDTSLGTKTSEVVCAEILSLTNSFFDANTRCETYFDGGLEYGQVKLKVFLVAK
jgi:hypothetical protein